MVEMRYFVEYALVQERAVCWGGGNKAGEGKSLEACATTCSGVSDMFTYSIRAGGVSGVCGCEIFTKNGRCRKQVPMSGFNLYSLQSPSKEVFTFSKHSEFYSYSDCINSSGKLCL